MEQGRGPQVTRPASRGKPSLKYIVFAVISLLDDAIIVTLLILLVSHFIEVPLWLIIPVGIVLVGWAVVSVVVIRKNPQLGFENMVGAAGVTVGALSPKGTVRIGHELWAAKAESGHIGSGTNILVVDQSGLLLTVVEEKDQQSVEISILGGPR